MTDQEPIIVVRSGRPTEEEIAALVIALAAVRPAATAQRPPDAATGSGWAARWRGLRAEHRPGRGAWRLSARR